MCLLGNLCLGFQPQECTGVDILPCLLEENFMFAETPESYSIASDLESDGPFDPASTYFAAIVIGFSNSFASTLIQFFIQWAPNGFMEVHTGRL